MNYAALLGVIAAAAFTLPGVALLAEGLGLHRNAGVAASLGVAALTAVGWFLRARRAGDKAEPELPPGSPVTLIGSQPPSTELLTVKEEPGAPH